VLHFAINWYILGKNWRGDDMGKLPRYYTVLFNVVSDAIAALEQQNYGIAMNLLLQGQQEAEKAFVEEPESKEQGGAE
jgi:hypothetical protein